MERFCSLFSQIVSVIPKGRFAQLAREHGSERHARGFTSWEQLTAMLLCHLGRMHSLREIEHGLQSAGGKLGRRACAANHRYRLLHLLSDLPEFPFNVRFLSFPLRRFVPAMLGELP